MKLAKSIAPSQTEDAGGENIATEPVEDQSGHSLREKIGIRTTPYSYTSNSGPIHTIQRNLTRFENRRESDSKSMEWQKTMLQEIDGCLRDILEEPMDEKVFDVYEKDLTEDTVLMDLT